MQLNFKRKAMGGILVLFLISGTCSAYWPGGQGVGGGHYVAGTEVGNGDPMLSFIKFLYHWVSETEAARRRDHGGHRWWLEPKGHEMARDLRR